MLFAGHDTTAYTIDAAFAMLALHQDIQQDVYEQVSEVMEKQQLVSPSDHYLPFSLLSCCA